MSDTILDDLISINEAAELRGVDRTAIHGLITRGRLASVKVGGKTLLRRSDVLAFQPQRPGPQRKPKPAAKKAAKKRQGAK